MHINKVLKDVLSLLYAEGIAPMVAGGYARDLYYGYMPKDADVFVQEEMTEAACFDAMKRMSATLSYMGYSSAVMQAYDKASCDFNSRIMGLIKVQGIVDIIFLRDPTIHPCDTFDFTFNQFILTGDEVVHYTSVPTELVPLREDIHEERRAYMQTKWETYHAE